ncbi:dihydroorotate dehydrogenase [Methanosalsum natronophilum]|uniref:Dihydroorotate dehydrogenase n=1 Tax=Methanosalsum natronophilum TaxID=768733 RepID=A0A3R7XTZ9_9EURY|nr:dihydroorotate dehydrogenase [Methanosalsum natronophilum]MCS3923389.1 dihydroorotate dehydrogenase (NAD+) catalytic subunit [Methanosalsum natronophilum]RQD84140.1 MAG: dihydroorotate dehydrogenase [Methanosalsum natronophilum]
MINITGLKLKNPTILAAGIMGTTGASLIRISKCGAGALVTKSIGISQKEGHKNPTMIQLESGGYINAMGLPNPSYHNFKAEIEKVEQNTDTPVIVSIFGGTASEFVEIATQLLKNTEKGVIDAFELNVSCPHAEGYGSMIGCDPGAVGTITAAVKDVVDVPVWVKLTPNVTDIVPIGRSAQENGADAIVAINTVKGMAIDISSGYPILGNRFGGLSGPPVKPIAIKCIYDLYAALDIPIIGAGGVSCWEDAVEMMMAGASGVQIGSAVYDDINIFSTVSKGIDQFITENDTYTKIEDIIGIAHTKL